jgi:hypothetical protein
MHYREILKAITTKPFVPFDVVMSSGDRYPVKHPENLLILKDCLHIPIYTRRTAEGQVVAADDYVSASYLHVAALERVASPEASTENSTDSLT